MSRSLKEQYKTRRVQMIQEKVTGIDKRLLQEAQITRLIVEAMSSEDLDKVSKIIDKLRSVKSPQLPVLSKAISDAEAELNKYTAGGPLTAAWTKLKGLFGVDNPVVKVTTFADALERGFAQIPMIIKNNVGPLNQIDVSKSLMTLMGSSSGDVKKPSIGAKTDSQLASTSFSSQNEADAASVPDKVKIVADQMIKALAPGGIFGAFKKIPYLNARDLANELINAPVNVIAPAIKKMRAGEKAADVAPDLKATITGRGEEQTRATNVEDPSKETIGSQPSTPTKDTVDTTKTAPTGEAPAKPRGGGDEEKLAKAKARLSPLLATLRKNPKNIDSIVAALVHAGLDVDKLPSA